MTDLEMFGDELAFRPLAAYCRSGISAEDEEEKEKVAP